MKGFLKQDLYHLALNGKFSLVFLAAMAIMVVVTDMSFSFLHLYLTIFSASFLLSLFNYDAANHWQSYAAAVPGGRKAQVDGRYVLALLAWVTVTALVLALSFLPDPDAANGGWQMALVMGGVLLLYVDMAFPLNYRFGPQSRVVFIILIAIVAGVVGVTVASPNDFAMLDDPTAPALLVVGVGLALMPVSYAISRIIVARKEG